MADQYNYPYTPPAFLQEQSADEIHSRMLEQLPVDIDKGEYFVGFHAACRIGKSGVYGIYAQ